VPRESSGTRKPSQRSRRRSTARPREIDEIVRPAGARGPAEVTLTDRRRNS
jgi:hypothetical protein